jgi:hypothetical protein
MSDAKSLADPKAVALTSKKATEQAVRRCTWALAQTLHKLSSKAATCALSNAVKGGRARVGTQIHGLSIPSEERGLIRLKKAGAP